MLLPFTMKAGWFSSLKYVFTKGRYDLKCECLKGIMVFLLVSL